jgi:predicted dehydrogenase
MSGPTRRALLTGAAGSALFAAERLALPDKVRVAIVGLDGHPGEITKPLNEIPDLDIIAIAAPERQVRDFVTGSPRLAGVKAYGDYRRMLDLENPDVVAVCNNDGERAGAILEAARHTRNIIAEKPLAITRRDYERVKAVVRDRGIRLGMLLPMRYEPPYLALKQIVQSGDIGEVIQISGQKSYQLGERDAWYKNSATYGSTILWIGIHMIDLMRWTSGREFVAAASFMGRAGFTGFGDMETTTSTSFRLDNGGTATLHMDYCLPSSAPSHGDDRLRLAGTKGVAEYMAATGVTLATTARKPHRVDPLPAEGSVFRDYLAWVFAGAAPTLPLNDIYAACDATLAAHEAAVEMKIVKLSPA